jgi:hypothetical protein
MTAAPLWFKFRLQQLALAYPLPVPLIEAKQKGRTPCGVCPNFQSINLLT